MKFDEQLKSYLSNPGWFSILIIGERGTGKTKFIKEFSVERNVKEANCASFSDDTMAESELFGHKGGAFTGAGKEDKEGLFQAADKGVLFLDEVHNLSKRVQEKLMTALQTESSGDNKGKFKIRKLGDTKDNYVKVRPVFASNKPIDELKKLLLPDLYDRISQLVLKIPSIHESKVNLKEAFSNVWNNMQFEKKNEIPEIDTFYEWLNRIKLDGNYRTLQNIAINWHQGRLMNLQTEENVFEFVKTQIETYHSSSLSVSQNIQYNFRKDTTRKVMEKEYHNALYSWAKENYLNMTDKEIAKELDISRLDILKK